MPPAERDRTGGKSQRGAFFVPCKHGDVTGGVKEERSLYGHQRDQHTSHCGANHSRPVENAGVQADGVRETLPAHEFRKEALSCWPLNGAQEPRQGGHDVNVPEFHNVR